MAFKSITLVASTLFLSSSVSAAPIKYDFFQNGYDEGAFVTGSFTGEDLDKNGQLTYFTNDSPATNEITAFTFNFSGNSLVESFSLDYSQLFGLVYDLDGGHWETA